jgi:hypothetical protein
LVHPLDYPHTWTERQAAEYEGVRIRRAACISVLLNADDVAEPLGKLADVDASIADHLEKQTELEQQLSAAFAAPQSGDGRERDRQYAHQRHLQLQLQLLRVGQLLRAPGISFGRLSDIEQRRADSSSGSLPSTRGSTPPLRRPSSCSACRVTR